MCEKFAKDPEFGVGNFAVHLKREISHAKFKCHETPPPLHYARALDYAMHNYARCISTETQGDCKQEGSWDC